MSMFLPSSLSELLELEDDRFLNQIIEVTVWLNANHLLLRSRERDLYLDPRWFLSLLRSRDLLRDRLRLCLLLCLCLEVDLLRLLDRPITRKTANVPVKMSKLQSDNVQLVNSKWLMATFSV